MHSDKICIQFLIVGLEMLTDRLIIFYNQSELESRTRDIINSH